MSFKNPGNIKVSVILPVYNVESYISQCLDTLIHQSLHEIEIILIDDSSTDRSGAICDEYAINDDRIVVIHNTVNIRQGLSRNKGIEIASGEYIGFVDPDDWVDLDFYEKLYNAAIKGNFDIAKSTSKYYYQNGEFSHSTDFNRNIKKGQCKGKPLFLLFMNEHGTAIYRKEIMVNHNIRYPDIRNAEDDVFLLQYTYFAKSITLVSESYHYYRQHEESTISIREWVYYESILQCFKLQLEFANSNPMLKTYYHEIVKKYIGRLKIKYDELSNTKGLENNKTRFFYELIDILQLYKYECSWILDAFVLGFDNKEINQQFYSNFSHKYIVRLLSILIKYKKKINQVKHLFYGI